MFIMKNAGCDGKCTQMHLSMVFSTKRYIVPKRLILILQNGQSVATSAINLTVMMRRQSSWRFSKAIRNGGCGLTFLWSTLRPIEDNITNLNGLKVRCNPTVKYKNEIAAYKRKMGIALSDEESKLADLVLHNGKKSNKLKKGRAVMGATVCGVLCQWSGPCCYFVSIGIWRKPWKTKKYWC